MNNSSRVSALFTVVVLITCANRTAMAQSRAEAVLDSMPHVKHIEQAAISPDGRRVAYIVGGELAIVPATGGASWSISVENQLAVRDVSWSSDSKQVAFLADLPGDVPAAQVWTASATGGAPVKRAELKGFASSPSFSPDG